MYQINLAVALVSAHAWFSNNIAHCMALIILEDRLGIVLSLVSFILFHGKKLSVKAKLLTRIKQSAN